MEQPYNIFVQYPIIVTDTTLLPIASAYVMDNMIYVQRVKEDVEILELFSSGEIYYISSSYNNTGTYYGTYSSSLSNNITTFFNSEGSSSGYTNVVV
jgi:hypothetical protein